MPSVQGCGEALTETYIEPSHKVDAATLEESQITDNLCLQGASITVEETWPHGRKDTSVLIYIESSI